MSTATNENQKLENLETESLEKENREPEMENTENLENPENLENTEGMENTDPADASQNEEETETGGEEAGKKLFGKKKDKATEKLSEKIAELEDARVRQLAEFENFRKRSEKEKSQMFEVGAKSVVEKILPVLDNFERGLAGIPEEEKGTPFVEGIEMVYKQMLTALEEMGVKPIEAAGAEFDPNFHNAVMTVDDDTLESGTVAEELQKGYLYKDSVVRHSMVKVVN